MIPTQWAPDQKLFPHPVAFACRPFDHRLTSDVWRMSPETVGVHGWMLHVPDDVHGLDRRKASFGMMDVLVHCMARNGVDDCGPLGSNWTHA